MKLREEVSETRRSTENKKTRLDGRAVIHYIIQPLADWTFGKGAAITSEAPASPPWYPWVCSFFTRYRICIGKKTQTTAHLFLGQETMNPHNTSERGHKNEYILLLLQWISFQGPSSNLPNSIVLSCITPFCQPCSKSCARFLSVRKKLVLYCPGTHSNCYCWNRPEVSTILGSTQVWKRGSSTSRGFFQNKSVRLKHISKVIRRRKVFTISNTQRWSLASKHIISF